MRYIPTSAQTVESLKKQAKKLQRKGGGKHADLLDRVAKGAGYLHWHHVTQCEKQTKSKRGVAALQDDCEIVIRAAREGVDKIIVTDAGELPAPLVLFASLGDAWMLDPDGNFALCLMFKGEVQERQLEDSGREIRINWDGHYGLDGDAFAVKTEHPLVGTRVIVGYPLAELRQWIDKAQSFDKRFSTLMLQDDAVDLTPDLVRRLITEGWDPRMIEDGVRDGARYSPSRNTLLYPQAFGGFGDDDDGDEGPAQAGP